MISYATRIELNKEYKLGATMKELSIKYKICIQTVQKYIIRPRKQGVKKGTRIKVTEKMQKQFVEMYADERSMNYIARKFKVAVSTVERYLNKEWDNEL